MTAPDWVTAVPPTGSVHQIPASTAQQIDSVDRAALLRACQAALSQYPFLHGLMQIDPNQALTTVNALAGGSQHLLDTLMGLSSALGAVGIKPQDLITFAENAVANPFIQGMLALGTDTGNVLNNAANGLQILFGQMSGVATPTLTTVSHVISWAESLGSAVVSDFEAFIQSFLGPTATSATFEAWLGAIPQANLNITSIATSLLTGPAGSIPAALLAALDASKITTGTFAQSMVTNLTTDLSAKALQTDFTALMSNLGAGTATLTAVTNRFANLSSSGVMALSGLASGALPSLITLAGSQITTAGSIAASLLAPLDASKITTGTFATSMVTGLTGYLTHLSSAGVLDAVGSVTGLAGYLTNLNTSGVLGLTGLAAGSLPSGVTLPGGQLTGAGSVAASLLAVLDASKITTGTFAPAQIPLVTAAMTTGLAIQDDIVNGILNPATAFTNTTSAQMQAALQAIPHANMTPALGPANLAQDVQGIVSSTYTAIGGAGAATLANLQAQLGALSTMLGFTPIAGQPNVNQTTTNNNTFIANTAVNNPLQHGVDPTVNGPFDLSSLMTNSTLPTVAATAGGSLICFSQMPNAGVKQSVRWLGYTTGTLTSFVVNVYALNATTGVCTQTVTSGNILGSVGTGSTPVWNSFNLPTNITTTQGAIYALEIAVQGSGSYNVVGVTNYLPTHPSAIPAKYGASRTGANQAPIWAAQPAGLTVTTTGGSFNVTIDTTTANTGAIMLAVNFRTTSAGINIPTVGGVAMTVLASSNYFLQAGVQSFWGYIFGLKNPPSGTVAVNIAAATGVTHITAQPFLVQNVGSFGAAFANSAGTGTALSQSIPAGTTNQLIFQLFAQNGGVFTGTPAGYDTGHSLQTWVSGVYAEWSGTITGAAGALSVSATIASSGQWAGLAVPINGVVGSPPPTFTPATGNPVVYTNATPWIGMGGSPGVTTYTPQLVQIPANSTFDPTAYPWANWFDVLLVGGGGGGGAGSSTSAYGGTGGSNASWATPATLTKVQAGSSLWTFTIGAGGAPQSTVAANGNAGAGSTCAIPSYGTISAAGGAGGVNPGPPAGTAGASMPALSWTDHYGNNHSVPGGGGGGPGTGAGAQPGGGGGGGVNFINNPAAMPGGPGGSGIGYVYIYQ